jgi:hypothetical protein
MTMRALATSCCMLEGEEDRVEKKSPVLLLASRQRMAAHYRRWSKCEAQKCHQQQSMGDSW